MEPRFRCVRATRRGTGVPRLVALCPLVVGADIHVLLSVSIRTPPVLMSVSARVGVSTTVSATPESPGCEASLDDCPGGNWVAGPRCRLRLSGRATRLPSRLCASLGGLPPVDPRRCGARPSHGVGTRASLCSATRAGARHVVRRERAIHPRSRPDRRANRRPGRTDRRERTSPTPGVRPETAVQEQTGPASRPRKTHSAERAHPGAPAEPTARSEHIRELRRNPQRGASASGSSGGTHSAERAHPGAPAEPTARGQQVRRVQRDVPGFIPGDAPDGSDGARRAHTQRGQAANGNV
jgi:hypothetical protein